MDISDATVYDLFSATIDGEYTSEEIERAANVLGFGEDRVLLSTPGFQIVQWLEENRQEVLAARSLSGRSL